MTSKDTNDNWEFKAINDADDFIQNLCGYRNAILLITLNELSICEMLATGSLTIEAILNKKPTHPLLTQAILDASVALGILGKQGDNYSNTELAQKYLVRSSKEYLGDTVKYHLGYIPYWSALPQMVFSSESAVSRPAEQSEQDPQAFRAFIRGVNDAHRNAVKAFADRLDLNSCHRLLDVGTGPGSYSVALLEKYPDLHCVLQDLPPVLDVAKEIIEAAGLMDRVTFLPGDFNIIDYGENFDAILFSNVLHLEGRESAKKLLLKARKSLRDGGLLLVNEPTLEASRTEPRSTAVFNLTVILRSGIEGALFTNDEVEQLLQSTGFRVKRTINLPPNEDLYNRPYRVFEAVKT
jgi:cyclopropane fatty-acyl-phospholipid synthase-like methyltransferase